MFAFKDAGGCWSFLMNNRCCYSDCTPHQFRNGKMGRSQNRKQRHWRSYFSTKSRVLNYWHIPFCIICESLSFCIGGKNQHDCTLRFCNQLWRHKLGYNNQEVEVKTKTAAVTSRCDVRFVSIKAHTAGVLHQLTFICAITIKQILRWRQCCDSNTLVARGAYFIEMCC